MANFLANSNSLTLSSSEKTGHYPKAGRQWATSRQSNSYDIKIGNSQSSPKKDASRAPRQREMDAE